MTELGERHPSVGAVDIAAFGCELAAVCLLAASGWSLGTTTTTRLLLAVLLPVLLVSAWGRWIAPKAPRRLGLPARFVAQLLVFAVVATLAWPAGHPWWAAGLLLAAVPTFGALARRDVRAGAGAPTGSR